MPDAESISDVQTPPKTDPPAGSSTEAPNAAALLAELQKERKARQALEASAAEFAKAAQERDDIAKRHEAYTAHVAKANADALAGLPEAARNQLAPLIEGKDPVDVAQLIGLVRAVQPAPGAVQAPAYPAGVQNQAAAAPGLENTPDETQWVETVRPDLRGVSPAVIRKMYKQFGPKK